MSDFAVFARNERAGWETNEIVRGYLNAFGEKTDLIAERLLNAVNSGPRRRILDLCCGQSNLAALLADRGATVEGLDFSPAMLARDAGACPAALPVGDIPGG